MKKINEYWPMAEIKLNTIAGSMEAGKDLFLLGTFGGFGGSLIEVHRDIDEAKEAAAEYNKTLKHHISIYRMSISLEQE